MHCEAWTEGAEFRPEISGALERAQAVFRKGEHAAAYSGFEGFAEHGDVKVSLADWLRAQSITGVDVVGIATDHCVRATALDGVRAGFTTRVLLDLCAGVGEESTAAARAELAAAGVHLA